MMGLFQKKEPIGAKRFCEVNTLHGRAYLENAIIVGEAQCYELSRTLYTIKTTNHIPSNCKIGAPFAVFYDCITRKLYAVSPRYDGSYHFVLDGTNVVIGASELTRKKGKYTIAGRVDLELCDT